MINLNVSRKLTTTSLEPWRLAYGDSGLLDFYLDYWNKYYGADGTNPDILIMFANTCVEFGQWPRKQYLI